MHLIMCELCFRRNIIGCTHPVSTGIAVFPACHNICSMRLHVDVMDENTKLCDTYRVAITTGVSYMMSGPPLPLHIYTCLYISIFFYLYPNNDFSILPSIYIYNT